MKWLVSLNLVPRLSSGALSLLLSVTAAAQAPVVPGLHGKHGLGDVAAGRMLFEELRCAACHGDAPPGTLQLPPGPDLEQVGWRVAPGYLQRFIADPAAVQPGTKMPGLLADLADDERADVAEALTHFLVGRSRRPHAMRDTDAAEAERGASLFHRVGCVACHGPLRSVYEGDPPPPPRVGDVGLTHVPGKYSLDSLSDFLFQPLHVRADGRMPDMGLSRAEAAAIAHYLMGPDPRDPEPFSVEPELAAAGARHFEQLGCAACHALGEVPDFPGIAPIAWSISRGCLSAEDLATPRYALDSGQRNDIGRFIVEANGSPPGQVLDSDRIRETLTRFNCIACHKRSGYGGVRREIDLYFESEQPALGDHARIPPGLTSTGAKLKGEWLRKVLFDGASVRPYMHTRMPQFGTPNLTALPALFASADEIAPFEMPIYTGDAARDARDGGRALLGSKGLNCISCHNFNGRLSPSQQGLDLITSCERLQPDWFARFLIAPQEYRPGIVMPDSWAGGIASHESILGGDTESQIRGIWFFLSQGRTASMPEGLLPRPSRLAVTDRARTYRGRSGIAGFRGIAVGFPGGVNYAFDANNGTLCGLWYGDYISVRWDGQGAGNFNPAARATRLAQDVSFARLASASDPWPLMPHMDKEHPINPDPQYPRNHGYRFRGYSFDEADVPTFMYETGAVTIEDRSVGRIDGDRALLTRVLRFDAPETETLWFRALAGNLETLSPHEFKLGNVKLSTPDVPTLSRPLSGEGADQETELLLELTLPKGTSEWRLEYEILR